MSDFEHETISMDDLRVGFGKDLLAQAEVILAINADSQEDVLHGKRDWDLAVGTGHEADLSVVRVELEASGDIDELKEMIETAQSGVVDDDAEEPVDDEG